MSQRDKTERMKAGFLAGRFWAQNFAKKEQLPLLTLLRDVDWDQYPKPDASFAPGEMFVYKIGAAEVGRPLQDAAREFWVTLAAAGLFDDLRWPECPDFVRAFVKGAMWISHRLG